MKLTYFVKTKTGIEAIESSKQAQAKQKEIEAKFNKIKTLQEAAGLLAQAQATQEKIKKQFHHIEGLGKLSRKIKRFQFQKSL